MTVTDAADATPEGVGDPILDLLNGFIVQLRAAGLPVSLTENLDAMQAIRHVPLEDRETFKYALAATLVKHHNHWKAFETVFEVYFSLRGDEYQVGEELVERVVVWRCARPRREPRPHRRQVHRVLDHLGERDSIRFDDTRPPGP